MLIVVFLVAGALFGAEAAAAQSTRGDTLAFDVRGMSLSEALSHAADVMRLDLAFALERVEGKTSHCSTSLPPAGEGREAEALLQCVLRETDLEARRLTSGAFVIAQPRPAASPGAAHSVVRGVVRDRSTDSVLVGVNVTLEGTYQGDATNSRGMYQINQVPPGRYVLQVTRVGFLPIEIGPVHAMPADTLHVDIALTETAIRMEEIVVDPSFDPFMREVAQTLPADYQSLGIGGVNVGLFMSAAGEEAGGAQLSPLGNLAGTDLNGLQLSGGVNAAGRSAHGVQLGGVGNLAGADLRGVQIGGGVSAVGGTLRGVQAAGSANLAYGAARGVQLGGAVNVAGDLSGGQFGGVVNVATGGVRGVQVVGGLNVLRGTGRGVQLAGGLNVGRGAVRGLQLAGGGNITGGRVAGVQIASLNVAGTVHGLQLGVINVARRYRGVPIGIISYVHDVGLRYDTWINESGMMTVALRSGTHHVSNFLGIAVRPQGTTRQVASVAGLGVKLAPVRRLSAGIDVLNYSLINLPREELGTLLQARLTAGYDVGGGFSIAAGPTFNFWMGLSHGNELVPWVWTSGRLAGESYRIGPGLVVGLRFAR